MKARVGWFLATHHTLMRPLHRLAHRTGDRACWVCAAVWAAIADNPVFVVGMREADADFAAGRVTRYRADDVR